MIHRLPGVIFWLLSTIAASVAYHRGQIPWLLAGVISVFAFAVGVAVNQRHYDGP